MSPLAGCGGPSLPWGIWTPSNYIYGFLNHMSQTSAASRSVQQFCTAHLCAQQTNIQTHRRDGPRYVQMCISGPHLCTVCMRCGLTIIIMTTLSRTMFLVLSLWQTIAAFHPSDHLTLDEFRALSARVLAADPHAKIAKWTNLGCKSTYHFHRRHLYYSAWNHFTVSLTSLYGRQSQVLNAESSKGRYTVP